MIQDLHSHTYYSFCGRDDPEKVVSAAIEGGIELLGITDHSHGIGACRPDVFRTVELSDSYYHALRRYFDHMTLIKEKYADRITVLRGIEVCTLNWLNHSMPDREDISYFDYALIEHFDNPDSITGGDLFSYAKRLGCPCGIAHTDMFSFIASRGKDPLEYFKRMAEENIFWEMNVSYDSIHNYRVHKYMTDFFESEEQQEIILRSGVKLSIGFDGHRVEDYLPERVKEYCLKLERLGIPQPFEK